MNENDCYTCFKISGDFDPDVVTKKLKLQPDKFWKKGDMRRNGTMYGFSFWEFGRCDNYDAIVANQMQLTIAPLADKVNLLNEIREKFDVVFTLEIVPTVYAGNSSPCLAPSMNVIDFCYATRTEIDIDLHVMDE